MQSLDGYKCRLQWLKKWRGTGILGHLADDYAGKRMPSCREIRGRPVLGESRRGHSTQIRVDAPLFSKS